MNRTIRFVSLKAITLALVAGRMLSGAPAPKKAIIFDIGNVLIKSDPLKAFQVTGLQNFAWYFGSNPAMLQGASRKIRCQVIYPFLHKLLPSTGYPVYDEFGERMPQIMVDWMTGAVHPQRIQALCKETCAIYSSWFSGQAERDLVYAMTQMMFTAQNLAYTQTLLHKSADFVRACKREGYAVYILSNFDAYTYAELEKKYPAFFALFDGKIISGQCGLVKPDPEIYAFLLRVYQLDPHNCFFIDDVIQNVAAARRAGIAAAQCTNCDIDTVKLAFYTWKASSRTYGHAAPTAPDNLLNLVTAEQQSV